MMYTLLAVAEEVDKAGMTGAEWVDLIVKIVVAIGGLGGLTAFFMVRAQKRKILAESSKTDAEAESIVADAQGKKTDRESRILDMYERGMAHMQDQLDDANAKIDRLTEYVEVLIQALRESGTPVPRIPPTNLTDAQQRRQDVRDQQNSTQDSTTK